MSDLLIPFFIIIIYASILIGFEGINFLFFYYTSFPVLKKEWLALADQFSLTSTIKPYGKLLGWTFNLTQENFHASGYIQNYPINITWGRKKGSNIGVFTSKIEIKNPHYVDFLLKKGSMLIGKKNLTFETPYFKEKFNISTNTIEEISQVFNEEIQDKVRKIFAIELDAILSIKKIKNKNNFNNNLIDATDYYELVYFNPNYQINNKRQNLFIQETLLSMLNIAKRIDAII